MASADYARGGRRRVRRRPAAGRDDDGARVRCALPRRGRPAVRAGGVGRAADHRRARRQRPAAARGAADHPGAGLRRGASRSPRGGTARTGCATPSPRGSRCRRARRCSRRARRCSATSTARCSPRTSTRTAPRSTPCAGCSRITRTTPTPTTGAGCSGRAACWRTTCTPTTPSSTCWRRRARPSRTARRATARWAAGCSRCAGTSSAACGWRWAPTSAPGRASRCCGRACRRTSCSPCSAPDGLPLTPAHLLYLATRAGAEALDLGEQVGDLSVGKQFDAVWVRPDAGSTLDVVLGHADDADDALAKVFALGGPADVRGVWVGGDRLR